MTVVLHNCDCLEYMKSMPDKSVDAIITDLPYGTTACEWDNIIPFEPMWEQVKRIDKGAFVTTASQPFTSKLVMSNLDWFKHEWVWDKRMITGIANAAYSPLKQHENIVVFGNGKVVYNPQLRPELTVEVYGNPGISNSKIIAVDTIGTKRNIGYPKTILSIPRPNNIVGDGGYHPTQKPTELYEYLIRTYTNEGDTVLDITMGSGTTGVACVQTGRNFIGCEIDEGYFRIAEKRISEAQLQMRLPI